VKKFFLIILIPVVLFNCSVINFPENVIIISGSDTMYELNEKLAKSFMKENPDISIYVKGGGTRLGILDLIYNKCDIASASRNLKHDESKLLAEYYGTLALVYLVAKDGLSVYVNPNNIVNDFSIQQLKDIFTGKIKNWKELGGEDKDIIVVTRNPNSGTYLFFKEYVLEGEDYYKNSIALGSNNEIIEYIKKNFNAIGYGRVGFTNDLVQVRVNGVAPTFENIRNDTYPITRYLHYLIRKYPSGNIKKFIDWVLSPNGQEIIRQMGFISLWNYDL